MQRKKRIVVLGHCLLNVNSKVAGLALYQGALKQLVMGYLDEGVGIIQLPCPETSFIGLKRWGMSKNQYDTPNYRKHCREILVPIVEQLKEYIDNEYIIEEIVGIDGSPSCGVNYYTSGYTGGMVDGAQEQKCNLKEESGKGILIEELTKLLLEYNLQIEFNSINEKEQPN